MRLRGFKPDILRNNRQNANDAHIASLDPLDIDTEISVLPALNQKGDTKSMIQMLYKNIPYPDTLINFDYYESVACMRDIGLFLGSLKRHGIEPVEAVPELDYILDELGTKTNLPPRDTLMHYTIWNPQGKRLRTYTHYSDEVYLIKSVEMSYRPLVDAIYNLVQLHQLDFEDPLFVELCEETTATFKFVVDAIVLAKRKVSPEIFANELRFYFDPIILYKHEVIGPGAVEMPMFVYDHILWSCDLDDEEHIKFKSTYLPFSEPDTRDVYYDFLNKQSLVTKMCVALNQQPTTSNINAGKALYKLCKQQLSFRMPHKKLADEAYGYESKENRTKGSGGYSTTILQDLVELNVKQIKRLHNSVYC